MSDARVKKIHLQEVTKSNFMDLIKLKEKDEQKGFVAPNSVSIAEAHYSDFAWMRGIYFGDTPVGFLMLADPVKRETGDAAEYNGIYYLWRLMIDQKHQCKGYAKNALDLLCDYVRTRPNADYLYASYGPGKNGPEKFYLKYGFEKTGKMMEHEIVIRIKL